MNTVAVVGLGLIGGSVARELAGRGIRVLGFDRDPDHLRAALQGGAVAAGLQADLHGVEEADTVVVAVPVGAAPGVLEAIAPRLGQVRLVTDVGSTKRSVVDAATQLGIGRRFVGSHPLAGDHQSGWAASRPGLFAGTRVFLCPTPGTGEDALARARELWSILGAHPELLDAAEHDRRLAWTSHLPQMLSTALAVTLSQAGVHRGELGRGGRDMTRLAGSSPEVWTDISLDNAPALLAALRSLECSWRELEAALAKGDGAKIRQFFADGNGWVSAEPALELGTTAPEMQV